MERADGEPRALAPIGRPGEANIRRSPVDQVRSSQQAQCDDVQVGGQSLEGGRHAFRVSLGEEIRVDRGQHDVG